jgi:hypothetical protein
MRMNGRARPSPSIFSDVLSAVLRDEMRLSGDFLGAEDGPLTGITPRTPLRSSGQPYVWQAWKIGD